MFFQVIHYLWWHARFINGSKDKDISMFFELNIYSFNCSFSFKLPPPLPDWVKIVKGRYFPNYCSDKGLKGESVNGG